MTGARKTALTPDFIVVDVGPRDIDDEFCPRAHAHLHGGIRADLFGGGGVPSHLEISLRR